MDNIRDMERAMVAQAAQPRPRIMPLRGAAGAGLGAYGQEAMMDPARQVRVSEATRISLGCQTFFFSRVESGYLVTTQQYVDWHLSAEDFAALVSALAALLPQAEE